MPWHFRLSLILFAVGAFGLVTMIHAHSASGWRAITEFARGLVLAVGGSLASLLLSLPAARSPSPWRRLALLEGLAALVLLAVVAILWRGA